MGIGTVSERGRAGGGGVHRSSEREGCGICVDRLRGAKHAGAAKETQSERKHTQRESERENRGHQSAREDSHLCVQCTKKA